MSRWMPRVLRPSFFVAAVLGLLVTFPSTGTRSAPSSPLFGPDGRQELECLALNIYWESRSEPVAGRVAVAAVTLNRVDHPAFPATVCGVVKQGGEWPRHRCQFSWWCDGLSDDPRDQGAWEAAQSLARLTLEERLDDPTGGALFYHADYVSPRWAARMKKTVRIGRHLYYRGDHLPIRQKPAAPAPVADPDPGVAA